jgi:hypothetical protein
MESAVRRFGSKIKAQITKAGDGDPNHKACNKAGE